MNKIFNKIFGLCLMLATAATFTACSTDEDPFFTAEETDSPRILNTDIPEWKDGQPAVLNTISRTTNFEFAIIATPIHYTTVEWFLDGEKIFEGDSINMPILAGDHLLKIVATTTKGLSTSRTTRLVVNPVEGDPVLGTKAKDLWVAPGATTTIHGCQNADKIAKIFVAGQEATNVKVEGDNVTFTVPATVAVGDQRVVLVDAAGQQYGGGLLNVTNEAYPEPAETTVWEGEFSLDWNLFELTKELQGKVAAGTTLYVTATINASDYHQIRFMDQNWSNLFPEYLDDYHWDGNMGDTKTLEIVLSQADADIINNIGFAMSGHGALITKVAYK